MEHFLFGLVFVGFFAALIASGIAAFELESLIWRILSGLLCFSLLVTFLAMISYADSQQGDSKKTCVKYEKRLVPAGKTLVSKKQCTVWLVEE